MSKRVNVRTRVRSVSRSRIISRSNSIRGRTPSTYEIGTPENYKNQRYKEIN